jgi:hypothetical protein
MGAKNQLGIGLLNKPTKARICKLLRCPGVGSARLSSLSIWYDNPLPIRLLAPMVSSNIPAQVTHSGTTFIDCSFSSCIFLQPTIPVLSLLIFLQPTIPVLSLLIFLHPTIPVLSLLIFLQPNIPVLSFLIQYSSANHPCSFSSYIPQKTRNRFKRIDSASLCSLASRYDNPIPTRLLAPIDCS